MLGEGAGSLSASGIWCIIRGERPICVTTWQSRALRRDAGTDDDGCFAVEAGRVQQRPQGHGRADVAGPASVLRY